MSAGYPITKADLDNRMGQLVTSLRDSFTAIAQFKTTLDDTTILPDAFLLGVGYTAGEVTQIRASFTALNNLYNISKSAGTQAVVNDFWFDAKHLVGLNLR